MTRIDKTALASVLAVSAAMLAGCDTHDGVRICSDGHGRRLPDTNCQANGNAGHAGTSWIYVRGGDAPAVGGAITDGERAPAADVHYRSAPTGGGFGGTGEGGGEANRSGSASARTA